VSCVNVALRGGKGVAKDIAARVECDQANTRARPQRLDLNQLLDLCGHSDTSPRPVARMTC